MAARGFKSFFCGSKLDHPERWDWDRSLSTCCEGIPDEVLYTRAGWDVVLNLAYSIDTTSSRAWVNALVSLTYFIRTTVRVDHTFWSTGYIWISKIFWNTLTGYGSVTPLRLALRPHGDGLHGSTSSYLGGGVFIL